MSFKKAIDKLRLSFKGNIHYDESHLLAYATDASPYRVKPVAVAYPTDENDLILLVSFAKAQQTALVPRAAGTSLAGQAVGSGIIVDFSKHMNQILEINTSERWVRVQPGVILDELNNTLASEGLFFGPETSTSNRCMIGGMAGNNACGSHSIIYGSTRDHLLSVRAVLSDGTVAEFGELTIEEYNAKLQGDSLENSIYRDINTILMDSKNQLEIHNNYPDAELHRRNTGYALDSLLNTAPFTNTKQNFNFCKLLAGSEGTLALTTELKLNLVSVPAPVKAVVAAHFNTLEESFEANLIALDFKPGAVELIDKTILDLTKENILQKKNRFFIQGDPAAILIIEFARESRDEIDTITNNLQKTLEKHKLGYHFPVIYGTEINKIWNLRKAGLGVLSNLPGDAKPVSLIEDTAIPVSKLSAYISEFKTIIEKHKLSCVYHAHIGSGELHLRPVLNLKKTEDVTIFASLAEEVAHLVKKYRGSMSGEHGDGRLRGRLIPIILGQHNYELLKQVKYSWDPHNIFNPGKIVDSPPIDHDLRYEHGKPIRKIKTYIDFSSDYGILRSTEKCNGSADCRKTEITGGLMCPSYMATRNEMDTTRARANLLREFLTNSNLGNPFDHKELFEVMELCISCKGCKSECPSNVDMSLLKAEVLQQYFDSNGTPLRSKVIASYADLSRIGSKWPALTNRVLKSKVFKKTLGFSLDRTLPEIQKETLSNWYKSNYPSILSNQKNKNGRKIHLFVDEFTNYQDVDLGKTFILFFSKLGYEIIIPNHLESGRAAISKGLVRKATHLAVKNVKILSEVVTEDAPLIGIEPSALLTFRDEYLVLSGKEHQARAKELSKHCYLAEEFIVSEFNAGRISRDNFTEIESEIRLHCHCHQQSIAGSGSSIEALSIPVNYSVKEIPSGCCGMAGSFGYEAEHADLSRKIGELILMKEVRKLSDDIKIAAQGTSCRYQIADGTGRKALHPVEILYQALKDF